MPYCTACGSRADDLAKYCRTCGTSLLPAYVASTALPEDSNVNATQVKIHEDKSPGFNAILVRSGDPQFRTIREVRELTGLELSDAVALVGSLPQTLRANCLRDEVSTIALTLANVGAFVRVVPSSASANVSSEPSSLASEAIAIERDAATILDTYRASNLRMRCDQMQTVAKSCLWTALVAFLMIIVTASRGGSDLLTPLIVFFMLLIGALILRAKTLGQVRRYERSLKCPIEVFGFNETTRRA